MRRKDLLPLLQLETQGTLPSPKIFFEQEASILSFGRRARLPAVP
jgi:hypothetical protein